MRYLPLVFVGIWSAIFATDAAGQTNWNWLSPTPTGNRLADDAWTGKHLVAVGYDGTIITSDDGVVWASRYSGSSKHLSTVASSGSMIVVAGSSGNILSSTDGISWTTRRADTDGAITSLIWTGSQFVAMKVQDSILTSPDGITWTARRYSGVSKPLYHIVWTGTQFVGAGQEGLLATSPDGIAWALQSSNAADDFWSIASNSTRIVAIGELFSRVSTDGVTWNRSNLTDRYYSVIWSDTIFVAVGQYGRVATSKDGVLWTERVGVSTSIPASVAWTGTKYVAVGSQIGFATGTVVISPDAVNWSQTSWGIDSHLSGIVWTGKLFVASAQTGGIHTSSDGRNWSEKMVQPYYIPIESMCRTGGRIFAFQQDGKVLVSYDGSDWITETWTANQHFLFAAASDSTTVAVGEKGAIARSDGDRWIAQASGTQYGLNSVAWGGGKFVAVGWNGTVLTSGNGSSWAAQNSGTQEKLNSVIWNGSGYLVVGNAGTILTSPDGSAWIKRHSGMETNLHQATWSGEKFVVVGEWGTILCSSDAVVWSAMNSWTTQALLSVIWTGSQFVAAGEYSTILSATQDGAIRIAPRANKPDGLLLRRTPHLFIAELPADWRGRKIQASIFSASGRHIRSLGSSSRADTLEMPVERLASGMYILTLHGGTFPYSGIFSVQN